MSRRDDYKLDSLVQAALRSGSMRPTPFGLHGRIWRRLEIAAMVDRERTRFRAAVLRVAAVLAAVVGGIATACWVWNPFASVVEGVPGSLGLVDYTVAYARAVAMTAFTASDWWFYAGTGTVLLIAFVLAGRVSLAKALSRRS